LVRSVNAWYDVAKDFIPCVEEVSNEQAASTTKKKSRIPVRLGLPSQLSVEARALCRGKVVKIEKEYRIAQAVAAVSSLRTHLRLRKNLWDKYKHNIAGEGTDYQTRSRAPINRVQEMIRRNAATYRTAWSALQALDPDGPWQSEYALHFLGHGDVSGPTPQADEVQRQLELIRASSAAESAHSSGAANQTPAHNPDLDTAYFLHNEIHHGRYEVPWIWTARPRGTNAGPSELSDPARPSGPSHPSSSRCPPGPTGAVMDIDDDFSDPEYVEQIRAEWCNAQARAERWEEEIEILKQEMYRTLLSLRA
jgi:hypothetical protein